MVNVTIAPLNDVIGDNRVLVMIFRYMSFSDLLTVLPLVCRRWYNIVFNRETMGNSLLWQISCFQARNMSDRDFSRILDSLGTNLASLSIEQSSKIKPVTKYRFLDMCAPYLRNLRIVGHMTSELFVYRLLVECRSLERLTLMPQFFDGDKKQSMKYYRFRMGEYVQTMIDKWMEEQCKTNDSNDRGSSAADSAAAAAAAAEQLLKMAEQRPQSEVLEVNQSRIMEEELEHTQEEEDNEQQFMRDQLNDTYTDMSISTGGNLIAAERVIETQKLQFRLPRLLMFELNVTRQFNFEYIKNLVGYIVEHAIHLRKLALHIPHESCLEELNKCTSHHLRNLYIDFNCSSCRIERSTALSDTITRFLTSGLHVLSIVGAPAVSIDLLVRFLKAGANSLRFFQIELQKPASSLGLHIIENALRDTDLLEGRIRMRRLQSFYIIGSIGTELSADMFTPLLTMLLRSPRLASGKRRYRIQDQRLMSIAETLRC